MGIYSGISGNEYLDTAGGKAALGLVIERFMETITATSNTMSYLRSATRRVDELQYGTATAYYDVMEVIGAGSYTSGNVIVDNLSTGQVKVNCDIPLIIA